MRVDSVQDTINTEMPLIFAVTGCPFDRTLLSILSSILFYLQRERGLRGGRCGG
jgi:hypothetical protein